MRRPATGPNAFAFDDVEGCGHVRARLTPACSAALPQIRTNSIPRPPRDFYFRFRVIKPVSRLSRAGLTVLPRSLS